MEARGDWSSRRILLVEDQEDNRQIVRDLLTASDYKIIEAHNGKEAIKAASEERPDLILMDIQLPIMSGYDATRRIKANPALRRIPIIAVTSYALSGEEAHARAAGCDDVVAKPYSPRNLLATRAASGQVSTAPPSSVMNSRRFTQLPRQRGRATGAVM